MATGPGLEESSSNAEPPTAVELRSDIGAQPSPIDTKSLGRSGRFLPEWTDIGWQISGERPLFWQVGSPLAGFWDTSGQTVCGQVLGTHRAIENLLADPAFTLLLPIAGKEDQTPGADRVA